MFMIMYTYPALHKAGAMDIVKNSF